MTVLRGLCIILAITAGFGLAGAGIGYTLGVFVPDYYRGVFRAAQNPHFDPLAVGIGLGLTQGLFAGLVVGSIVVVATTWYQMHVGEARGRKPPETDNGSSWGAQAK